MAPMIYSSENDHLRLQSDQLDDVSLDFLDDESITKTLKSQQPLPTTYLLALSRSQQERAGRRKTPLGDSIIERPQPEDNARQCMGIGMGLSDSVMTPLTAQDGPMLVVLISMIFSIVFVVEMYEIWQRRARRIYL